MKRISITLSAILALISLLSACSTTTTALWGLTNPRERVWISNSEITEQELITKNIPYIISNDELGDGYLIPKSKARQLGDYTIRLLATPITVTVDAATSVVVVGLMVLRYVPTSTI